MSKTDRFKIGWGGFKLSCLTLAEEIEKSNFSYEWLYPIHKNGLYVAVELNKLLNIPITYDKNRSKKLIVDDLIDSGRTLKNYVDHKAVLFVKNNKENEVNYYVSKENEWIVFPWEKENDIEDSIIRILEYIGENPTREGIKDTPKRIIRSWKELYGGYSKNPEDIIKIFEDGACDQLVLLKDVEFYSTCEHHMLPFFGKIHIGYIPNGKVIGVSKLARLVEIYSRRLQIQERLVQQIADDLEKYLQPLGIMIVCEAQHFCMTSRGIRKQHSKMVTSDVKGVFKEDNIVREEFLNLIRI